MKRRLSLFMALCLLLLSVLALMPVSAEEGNWKTLSFTPLPTAEGEPPATITLKEGENALTDAGTVTFDPAISVVKLNGKEIESGVVIKITGEYLFEVFKKDGYVSGAANNQVATYVVQILHDLKIFSGEQEMPFEDGVIFTFFPTIVCENAYQIEILNDAAITPVKTTGSYELKEFGSFTLTIWGMSRNNASAAVKTLHFSVRPCYVTTVYSTELEKCALNLVVGSFGEKNYTVMADGTAQYGEGSHLITKVGIHTFELYSNGEKAKKDDAGNAHMPTAEESKLRILVELPALEFDTPEYKVNFDKWDANVTLDGKPVSGTIELNKHGTHRLEVVDEEGHTVGDCFMLQIGEEAPVAADALEYTFHNPHYIYVIIVGAPAVLLLAAAVFFLIKRRTIV